MQTTQSFIPTFTTIDLVQRQLPLITIDSEVAGPIIWITAAIHGDEVTGTATAQSIIKRLQKYELQRGKIYIAPLLNPTGFEAIARREQYGEADLNRNFGGARNGTPSERLAWIILDSILETKPDFVIDLHTDSMNSIAYTIVDWITEKKYSEVLKKSLDIAQRLQLTYALDSDASAGYTTTKSLSGQLMIQGVPAVTVELGGPLVVNDRMRKTGLEAVWSVLHSFQMVVYPPREYPLVSQNKPFYFMERIATQSTGIIEYRIKPGDRVKKGAELGKIRDIFANIIETITSPKDCLVFSHEDQSVTFPGLDLFTLAEFSLPSK